MAKSNGPVQEMEFGTEYGVIAAKVYGQLEKSGCKRVLAVHGWMDNAGSFDKLIPLMENPAGLVVVALDLPGHGKSSQLPKSVAYHDIGFVLAMRLLVRRLGWHQEAPGVQRDKYTLVGHSLGAGLSAFYAGMFGHDLEQLIMLDFIKAPTLSTRELLGELAHTVDRLHNWAEAPLDRHGRPLPEAIDGEGSAYERKTLVSAELALKAIIHTHQVHGYLERDDAELLFKRSSEPDVNVAGGYYFVRDTRLNYLLNYRDHVEPNIHLGQGYHCHALVILGKRGLFNLRKKTPDAYTRDRDCMMEQMQKSCKTFRLVWLDNCDHYLHMSNAGPTADLINQALLEPGKINYET